MSKLCCLPLFSLGAFFLLLAVSPAQAGRIEKAIRAELDAMGLCASLDFGKMKVHADTGIKTAKEKGKRIPAAARLEFGELEIDEGGHALVHFTRACDAPAPAP
jgi:hypothetical protein